MRSNNVSEDKQMIHIGKSFADCIGLNDQDVVRSISFSSSSSSYHITIFKVGWEYNSN